MAPPDDEAVLLLSREKAEEAEKKFQRADAARVAGNECLQEGKYDEACKEYDVGLHELQHHLCQNKENTFKDRADKAALALHLNVALANIKRGELGKARLNCHMALTLDENNVKALYRRGLIQVKMAKEHQLYDDMEARAAIDDFEKALLIDPANAEVRKELEGLRREVKRQERDLKDSSKKTWAHCYQKANKEAGAELKKAEKEEVKEPIRDTGAQDGRKKGSEEDPQTPEHLKPRRLVAMIDEVVLGDGDGVTPTSLELLEGWCVGVFGLKGSGASELARVVAAKAKSRSGLVLLNHRAKGIEPFITLPILVAIGVGTVASVYGVAIAELHMALPIMVLVMGILILSICSAVWWQDAQETIDESVQVAWLTSDEADWATIAPKATVEQILLDQFAHCPVVRRRLPKDEAQKAVVEMLTAAGFQMPSEKGPSEVPRGPAQCVKDKIRYDQLSSEQKQLVQVLRTLASSPDLLVCEELLEGLDESQQPRVLRMIRRMKRDKNMCVLYASSDPHQLRLVADAVAFVHEGSMVEFGPAIEVLDFPRHSATDEYLKRIEGNKTLREIGQALIEGFQSQVNDAPINEGKWLPTKAKKKLARKKPPPRKRKYE